MICGETLRTGSAASGGIPASALSWSSRWRSASAPTPPSSASSTPFSCGRCRTKTPIAWCSSSRSWLRKTVSPTTSRGDQWIRTGGPSVGAQALSDIGVYSGTPMTMTLTGRDESVRLAGERLSPIDLRDAWRVAVARTYVRRTRSDAGRGCRGYPQLRDMAATLWREPGRPRPERGARRERTFCRRRAGARLSVSQSTDRVLDSPGAADGWSGGGSSEIQACRSPQRHLVDVERRRQR